MNNKTANALIDDFLERQSLSASDDFCEILNEKLSSENFKYSIVDDFVSAQPIKASSAFSAGVLGAISKFKRAEALKRFCSFVGAFAASIAISYTAFFYSGPRINERVIANEFALLDSEITNFNTYAAELESFNADFYDYDTSIYGM